MVTEDLAAHMLKIVIKMQICFANMLNLESRVTGKNQHLTYRIVSSSPIAQKLNKERGSGS